MYKLSSCIFPVVPNLKRTFQSRLVIMFLLENCMLNHEMFSLPDPQADFALSLTALGVFLH